MSDDGYIAVHEFECDECDGKGGDYDDRWFECRHCNGTGKQFFVDKEDILDLVREHFAAMLKDATDALKAADQKDEAVP